MPATAARTTARSAQGLVEKDLTLDVTRRTQKLLKQFGFQTVLTRSDDTFISLPERAAIGNRIDNAIFVSVHFNHAYSGASTGVETFYASEKVPPESAWTWVGFFSKPEPAPADNGETLAGFIQASMVMRTEADEPRDQGPAACTCCATRAVPPSSSSAASSATRSNPASSPTPSTATGSPNPSPRA